MITLGPNEQKILAMAHASAPAAWEAETQDHTRPGAGGQSKPQNKQEFSVCSRIQLYKRDNQAVVQSQHASLGTQKLVLIQTLTVPQIVVRHHHLLLPIISLSHFSTKTSLGALPTISANSIA